MLGKSLLAAQDIFDSQEKHKRNLSDSLARIKRHYLLGSHRTISDDNLNFPIKLCNLSRKCCGHRTVSRFISEVTYLHRLSDTPQSGNSAKKRRQGTKLFTQLRSKPSS
ncbi:hypothetical protein GQ457_02G039340 [Hibiscus cannabinus]